MSQKNWNKRECFTVIGQNKLTGKVEFLSPIMTVLDILKDGHTTVNVDEPFNVKSVDTEYSNLFGDYYTNITLMRNM